MEERDSVAADFAKTLKAQMDGMGAVPCSSRAMHAQCPLLKQARDAKDKYAMQIVQVGELRTSYRVKQEAARLMQTSLAQLPARPAAVAPLQQEIAADNEALHRLNSIGCEATIAGGRVGRDG